jgi:cation transport ATPase
MIRVAHFLSSEQDLRDLYHTYIQARPNYEKIKLTVANPQQAEDWRAAQRKRMIFVLSVAIVAALSSVLGAFYGDWSSIAAIWAIWLLTAILFAAMAVVAYQNSHKIWLQNNAFFDMFELIATTAISADDFYILWQQSQQAKKMQGQN